MKKLNWRIERKAKENVIEKQKINKRATARYIEISVEKIVIDPCNIEIILI